MIAWQWIMVNHIFFSYICHNHDTFPNNMMKEIKFLFNHYSSLTFFFASKWINQMLISHFRFYFKSYFVYSLVITCLYSSIRTGKLNRIFAFSSQTYTPFYLSYSAYFFSHPTYLLIELVSIFFFLTLFTHKQKFLVFSPTKSYDELVILKTPRYHEFFFLCKYYCK